MAKGGTQPGPRAVIRAEEAKPGQTGVCEREETVQGGGEGTAKLPNVFNLKMRH